MDKIRALGLDEQHARLLHDRQRRLAGRLSRRRLHAVPRHQGHRPRRRQPRSGDRLDARQDQGRHQEPRHRRRARSHGDVRRGRPASSCRRTIAKTSRSSSTATTCRRCCSAPASGRARPGSTSPRTSCRPARSAVNNYKFVFNLRGDNGATTGGLAVDTNLGWKGAEKYVATVPQVFDLWADPQERYDIFMNNFTERTWMARGHGSGAEEAHGDLRQVSAAQAAERGLHGPDHDLELREVPVGPRDRWRRKASAIPMPTGN